jgi:hypothetical protein
MCKWRDSSGLLQAALRESQFDYTMLAMKICRDFKALQNTFWGILRAIQHS